MRKEIIKCDICGSEKDLLEKGMDVIFETEQTEGRSSEPYLERKKLDICKECMVKVLKGNYVFASGIMGYNKYYFKDN